jgi:hypothetical protein
MTLRMTIEDVARLRAQHHQHTLTLNLTPKIVVATARINQSTFDYPLAQLTIDNAFLWENVRVGQMVLIGTTEGGSDVAVGVVRKPPAPTTLYIDAKSKGAPGYRTRVIPELANNQYISILSVRPPWSHYSRIADGNFYKQFDRAYINEGSQPAPLVQMGPHRQAYVDADTGAAVMQLTATMRTWGTATSASLLWDLGGGAIASGDETSSSIGAEFAPGFYVISCTGTDTNGKSHTAYRYVFANDKGSSATYPAFGDIHPYLIVNDTTSRAGRDMQIALEGDYNESQIYPGMAALLTETALFNKEALDDETQRIGNYFGYIVDVDTKREQVRRSVSLRCRSPFGASSELGAAAQQMEETTSPTNWTQVTSALSHPPGALYYVAAYHAPFLVDAHDLTFNAALLTYRKKTFALQGVTIGAQLEEIVKLLPGGVGCRSDGALVLSRSPLHMSSGDRSGLDTQFEWNAGDIVAPLNLQLKAKPAVGWVNGGAFAYNGGDVRGYRSRAPGVVKGQASGTRDLTVIVPSSDTATEQARCNAIAGHEFALVNSRIETLRTTADRNIDIAEPADGETWHTLTLPARYSPLGEAMNAVRALPVNVTRTWGKRGVKRIEIEWQLETSGQPGVTVTEQGAQDEADIVLVAKRTITSFLAAWDGAGRAGCCFNFRDEAPEWGDWSQPGEIVCGIAFDNGSSLAGADWARDEADLERLGAWKLTTAGTALKIYRTDDALAESVVWTLQHTYTADDPTVVYSARLVSHASISAAAVAWHTQTGTRTARYVDGSWQPETRAGSSSATDTDSDDANMGLCFDGDNIIVTAMSASGVWALYWTEMVSGVFSLVTSLPTGSLPHVMITSDQEGRVYFSRALESAFADTYRQDFELGAISYLLTSAGREAANPNLGFGLLTDSITIGAGYNTSAPHGFSTAYEVKYTEKYQAGQNFIWHVTRVQATIQLASYEHNIGTVWNIEYGYDLLDIDENVLHAARWSAAPTRLTSSVLWYTTYSAGEAGLDIDNVCYVRFTVRSTTDVPKTAADQQFYLLIDNLEMDVDGIIKNSAVYRVSNYTGTPAFVNVSPENIYGYVAHPFALDVTPAATQRLEAVSEIRTVPRRYFSTSRGTTWTLRGVVEDTGVRCAQADYLLFGDEHLDIEVEGVRRSLVGNWASVIGGLDYFRGVAGFFV